jgi:hypothetical protein
MTPNNILNMAMLKELDFVAITDHNSTKQLRAIEQIEPAYDFLIIPGLEVTVAEGFDVLCYFKTYADAYTFDQYLESHLETDNWGPFTKDDQVITDVYDITIDTFNKSLRSTTISYPELVQQVQALDGILILAHIDRMSKSALLTYSLDDITFDGVEVQPYNKESFLASHPEVTKYPIFSSSDSHTLLTILERIEGIELPEKSIEAFFQYVKGGIE